MPAKRMPSNELAVCLGKVDEIVGLSEVEAAP